MYDTSDGLRASQLSDVAGYPIPIRNLPRHLFAPSEELQARGWPDFSVRSLADLMSSAVPAPSLPGDCCLVLAFPRVVHRMAPAEGWICALHETGGIWQERKLFVARKLEVGQQGTHIIHAIARAMAHSNCTAEYALFDQLAEYRERLHQFGLDCNHHVQVLTEGFYPIDLAEEALLILDVIDPPADVLELLGSERACFAVIAPNCSEW